MKTLSYFASRLSKAVLVVLGVVILNFLLIRMAPGDPAAVLAGEAGSSDPAHVEQLRREFGLDQPVYVQLGTYLKGIVQLDLGYSPRTPARAGPDPGPSARHLAADGVRLHLLRHAGHIDRRDRRARPATRASENGWTAPS